MAEKKKSIEENLKYLEEITERLSSGDLSLEDSVKLYEAGMKAVTECNKSIDLAEKKVKVIRGDGKEDEL